ncbi:MAG: diguanylate cyclase (GGDEF)-like protein/PAS domain S-box-containing protein [Paraglaciecola sp.]|jgi:diguanylate cyclase (GGDEF)-like protein/PAS domain S-box-containing protein
MTEVDVVKIFNLQPFGISVLTPLEGNYIFFNEHERIFRKLSLSEMQSVSIFDLFCEEESQKLRTIFERCVASSSVHAYFFKYKNDKNTFQMRLVKGDNGNIISSLTDITHLDHLEEQRLVYKENIKCLSDAVSGANIGCWDYYPQEDRIVANETWVTQKKYKDEDFRVNTGLFSDVIDGLTTWASIVHPDDLEATSKLIEKHLNKETKVYDAKFRVKCGDNEWRWIHDIGRVFLRDTDGTAIRMNGVHIDITENKQAELREKSRTHILELITRGEPLPIILDAIVKVVEQNNPAMLCSILLLDDAGKHLLSGTASSLPDFYNEAIHGTEIGVGVGSCGTAAFINERVIVDDIQTHPYWVLYKELANRAKLVACWSEPIRSTNGKVLGTFAIYHRKVNLPTEADVAIIEQTASLASIAIEKKQAEEKLKRAASVFTYAHESIMITDASGAITEVNDTFSHMTGYTPEEVLGKLPTILQSERQSPEFYTKLWTKVIAKGHWHGEVWSRHKNGDDYAVRLTTSVVKDSAGFVQHYVSLCTDITLMKEHHGQLERMAHYDALTNLPNRVLLADRLSRSMVQCQRRNLSLAVAFMDLDGFKAINDLHGHNVGDELLIQVAQRMKEALREGDTLARIGGDEFIAVMVDLEKIGDSEPVLKRLLKAAATPVNLGEAVMQVSASIGVSFYPQDHVDADLLMRHSDQAMYVAKQTGKNRYHFFDTAQDNAIKTHGQSIGDIRSALDKREFVLHYQPKVNMHTGEVIGVEALIRWQHPARGLVPPLEFLPAIEGHAVSLELGEWVIDAALRQINQWRNIGVNLPISVNISAYQLQQGHFTTRLADLLAAHPEVPPHCLELEILETSALHDISQVSATMHACHELGVSFALDDFGTGYSSLTYLKRLPAYMIKIDQSFVRDMLEDADDLAIVEGVVGLAKAFRRNVIAEGVETIEHGVALLQLGCKLAQGYGIARPMPSGNIPEWVSNWKADDSWKA